MDKFKRNALVVVDQAFLSGLMFFSNIAFFLTATTEAFATFSLGVSAYLVTAGIFKSTVIIPYIYRCDDSDSDFDSWTLLSAVTTFAIALVLLTIGGLASEGMWRDALIVGAAIAVGLLPSEFKRRSWLDEGQYTHAATASIVACLSSILAVCGLWYFGKLSPILTSFSLGFIFLFTYNPLPIATLVRVRRKHITAAVAPLLKSPRLLLFTNLSGLLFAGYNQALPFVLGVIGGAPAVAVFAAGRLLVQPSWVIVAGLDTVERPMILKRFRADGVKAAFVKGRSFAALALAVTVFLNLSLLAAMFSPIGDFFFERGVTFRHICWWLFSSLLVAVAFPFEVTSHVIGEERAVFYCRCVSAATALAAVFLLPVEDVALRGIVAYTTGWVIILICNFAIASRVGR